MIFRKICNLLGEDAINELKKKLRKLIVDTAVTELLSPIIRQAGIWLRNKLQRIAVISASKIGGVWGRLKLRFLRYAPVMSH